MGRTNIILASVVLMGFVGMAQGMDKDRLDQYFDTLEKQDKFMGSVAISKDGEPIYSRALGLADLKGQIKADRGTKYRIGSISKTFTAVLVLQAVEAQVLELDRTLSEFFPSIENADRISMVHLLSHRSGIHNFTDDPQYMTYNTQAKTRDQMISIIKAGGSDFEPDARMSYSNSNYVLLSFILEEVFKTPYARLLEEHITRPLGLKDTYMGGAIDPGNRESRSYRFLTQWEREPETDTSIPLGAGGVVSTPSDLVRFSDALFGGKLLKEESLALMKDQRDQYGLGVFQIPFYDKLGFGHTGGIDGFVSVFSHFADGSVSYAMTSNGSRMDPNEVSIAVLSAVYDKPYEIPTEEQEYKVDSAQLEQYVGTYSSDQIPMKLTITTEKGVLMAQGSGQPAFALEPSQKDLFKYDPAGVVIEFMPMESSLILKQSGAQINFRKD